MRRIRVTDVDRCIYNGPSTTHHVEDLVNIGALNHRQEKLTAIASSLTPGNGLAYLRAVKQSYFSLLEGVSEDAQAYAGELTASRVVKTMFTEMEHRILDDSDGSELIIVSDGPQAVMRALAQKLGAVAGIGRRYEDFQPLASSSRLSEPHKVGLLSSLVEVKGAVLGKDVIVTRAWGDAPTDVGILDLAERPTIVNPLNDHMRELSALPDWEVLDCAALLPYGDFSGSLVR